MALASLAVCAAAPALAQPPTQTQTPAPAQTATSVTDQAAIALWADTVYGGAVDAGRIDGAVVAVVAGGKPVFARGYGFADAGRATPVTPEATTFRLASISKTFAAVLVAQLQAEGRVGDLDAPVSAALPPGAAPAPHAEALTLRHIFTHQSGLEEQLFAFATQSASQDRGPDPRFYRPPGERTNYSNTATGLLGALVEQASGESFAARVQARVFAPLGMRTARYRTEVAPAADLANASYVAPDGTRWPMPNNWMLRLDRAASGGVEASASDMQAYMIALLDQGATDPRLGLSAAQFAPLFAEQGRVHPAANAFGMAFFLSDWNGVRVVEHGGVFPGHRAYMHLVPELGIGVFVAATGEAATPPPSALIGRWNHAPRPGTPPVRPIPLSEMRAENLGFVLGPLSAPQAMPVEGSAASVAGRFAPERRNRSSIERALDLVRADFTVRTIVARSPTQIQIDGRWIYDEIAPGVFWRKAAKGEAQGFYDTLIHLPAKADGPDAFTFAYNDMEYQRIGPQDDVVLHRNVLLVSLLAGLTGALFWIGGGAPRGAALAPLAISGGVVAMVGTLMFGFPVNQSIINEWSLGDQGRAVALAVLGNVVAAAALATIGVGAHALLRGPGAKGVLRVARYGHHLGLMATSVALLWALYQLRLVGWWAP